MNEFYLMYQKCYTESTWWSHIYLILRQFVLYLENAKIQKHVFYLRIMVRHVERVIVMEYDPNLCWEWPTHYNCLLIVLHLRNWKVTLSIHTLERYMKSQRDGEIISNFLCHEHILITGDDRGHSDWGCYVSLGWMIISLCFIL